MASIAGMSWEAAERAFRTGYEHFQTRGPMARSPWIGTGDKRNGLFTAGKDAARRRVPVEKAWSAFRDREEAVM